jgi:methyl-accepting chemotaxis protein
MIRGHTDASHQHQKIYLNFPNPLDRTTASVKIMANKSLQMLLFAGAAIIALLFVKLMFDMSRSMSEMTGYVGAMSQDVREMQKSMHTMNDSLQRMEKSIHGLGRVFNQGSEQFQQMNPSGVMQQMWPGSGQRTR